MKIKIIKALIIVAISNLCFSQLYAKKEFRSLGGKHFNHRGCDSESTLWLDPDESAIFYFTEEIADPSLSKKILEIEMYNNKDFSGKPEVKLNKYGLYINQVKRCSWLIEDKLHDNKTYDYDFNVGFLAKYNLKDEKTEQLTCDIEGTAEYGFLVTAKTDKYYEIELDKKKYYISIKMNPQIKYIKSQNSISEELQQQLYKRFNENFLENQMILTNFVQRAKNCYIEKKNDKECDIMPKINERLIKYICYSKLVNCPDKISKWKKNIKIEDVYWKNLKECFEYRNMKTDLEKIKYLNDGAKLENKSIGNLTIFSRLNSYDHAIFCDYKIKFNENKIKDISLAIHVSIDFPDEEEELAKEEVDTPNYEMFSYQPKEYSPRLDKCNMSLKPKNIISVSEIGDKNAKKLGK